MTTTMRVIAIETGYRCPLVACVYRRDGLYLYDTQGELTQQKEYFADFSSLEHLVRVHKFKWSDFLIKPGEKLESDDCGELLVSKRPVKPLTPLPLGSKAISKASLGLFVETLKALYYNEPKVVAEIEESHENGKLLDEITRLAKTNPLEVLRDYDKQLVVMTRLHGYSYVVKRVRDVLSGSDWFRSEDANFLFSRLFRLEIKNWIRVAQKKG